VNVDVGVKVGGGVCVAVNHGDGSYGQRRGEVCVMVGIW
jgi:hypothetical protein